MKKIHWLALLAVAVAFSACRENFEEEVEIIREPGPSITRLVNGAVSGVVTSLDGRPVEGAAVSLGGVERSSDEEGLFLYQEVTMNSGGALLKVEKEGYFPASTQLFPEAQSRNYVNIQLIPKVVAGSFESAAGGAIDVIGGGSIQFPAGVITDDVQPYSGRVEVAARWLDPTDIRLGEMMPGSLQGISAEGIERSLVSFGMMAVEMRGAAGQLLELAAGAQATLSFPLPDELAAAAPLEIPLWYFDEEAGIWREEGAALRQAGRYVGSVSHFSFWNCDYPYPLVNLRGTVVGPDGAGIPNIKVRVRLAGSGLARQGYTDHGGNFSGPVPRDELLQLEIFDRCNNIIYSEQIGPLATDTGLGNIQMDDEEVKFLRVVGELIGCDGTPLVNGVVVIQTSANTTSYFLDEGSHTFSILMEDCNADSLVIYGVDPSELVNSFPLIVGGEETIELGALQVCGGQVGEYFSFIVDGQLSFYPAPLPLASYNAAQDKTEIFSGGLDSSGVFLIDSMVVSFVLDGAGPGNYSFDEVGIRIIRSIEGVPVLSSCLPDLCTIDHFEILEYGGVGEYISGSFSGDFPFSTSSSGFEVLPVSATFRVIRE